MNRELTGKRPHFRPEKRRSNPYRVLLWLGLILGGIWFLAQMQNGQIRPLFLPTATPTRTAGSYILEAQTLFKAGSLERAVAAYREAAGIAPDPKVWAEMARIQTYSSSLLSTDAQRFERMEEALQSIEQAIALNPDDVDALAIRSLVLDWYAASPLLDEKDRQSVLNDAEASAVRALQLDSEHALALAFFAEILVDQQKWAQAEETIRQAAFLDPSSMDVHRVYGYVWESFGQYRAAIDEYLKAAEINPNLTFLYIFIGRNYQSLEVYNRAMEYFEKAAFINEQLGVRDPIPYIEIAKTYARRGEFFAAALNAEKALTFDPTNANTYGQLGTIYTKARNYESARPAFQCAVRGCSAEENQIAQEVTGQGAAVTGLELTSGTVAFYYVQYGSVLAALSRPAQNYCPEALEVLGEVRAQYPDDPIFNEIIQENIAICNLLRQTPAP